MTYQQVIDTYRSLQPGDEVEVAHDVRVGFKSWSTAVTGTVVRTERRRHSLHFDRSRDDKVYSDVIVLKRNDGELTTVTLDEFSHLRVVRRAADTNASLHAASDANAASGASAPAVISAPSDA